MSTERIPKARARKRPTAFLNSAVVVAGNRRVLLSTGRGDVNLDAVEARELAEELLQAATLLEQLPAVTLEVT